MHRLLIIDGLNLLFQMFFGMPSRIINKEGKPIQGTLGFVGALLKIIKTAKPTHVVVLFDGEHENARTEINADYKANRTSYTDAAVEDNPFSQLADIYVALDYLAIKHTEIDEHETDDVIASYAIKYGNDIEIVIASFDSDFFQLIKDNISVLRYRGDKTIICDRQYIKDKFDITPEQYADFKSLTGDASDNIKGADNIGPKTAAQLINRFGTLTEIIRRADEIVRPSVKAAIQKDADKLSRNYHLIKLDDKAKIPFALEQLEYKASGFTTNEVLQGIGLR
jgi:DNA polymerase I